MMLGHAPAPSQLAAMVNVETSQPAFRHGMEVVG